MTTTETPTIDLDCPSWCTFDHDAYSEHIWKQFAADVASGSIVHTPAARQAIDDEIRALAADDHAHVLMEIHEGQSIYREVRVFRQFGPFAIGLYSEDTAEHHMLDSAGAREVAAALLAAADKLDELTGAAR